MVYLCDGTDSEKLDWFKTVNIAGEEAHRSGIAERGLLRPVGL